MGKQEREPKNPRRQGEDENDETQGTPVQPTEYPTQPSSQPQENPQTGTSSSSSSQGGGA